MLSMSSRIWCFKGIMAVQCYIKVMSHVAQNACPPHLPINIVLGMALVALMAWMWSQGDHGYQGALGDPSDQGDLAMTRLTKGDQGDQGDGGDQGDVTKGTSPTWVPGALF